MQRFRRPQDGARYGQAHALLRRALSAVSPEVAPEAWLFDVPQKGGKPFALTPSGARGPFFNLTHCHGLVAVAVSTIREVGLDAEPAERSAASYDLARRVFSPKEIGKDGPAVWDNRALTRLWCAKEALAKGAGFGLALDFAEIVIDPDRQTILSAPAEIDPSRWRFSVEAAPPGFTLALAWEAD
ncbi:MAG: 4'-phosphopantetheinyl transferase superfamily protein [Pseudomonadota bacterium]